VNDPKKPSLETSSTPQKILVVEDEPDIAALVAYQLTRNGFRVETALDGLEALKIVERGIPDLIILDRMLPGISGDEVLSSLKNEPETSEIPVLVLTAKKEQKQKIIGLELGADDYLTKPFSPQELVLRVRAILRRTQEPGSHKGAKILRAGSLRMDISSMQISASGEEISLTPTEFRLLQTLMESKDRTLSRRQLLENAWDVESGASDRLETRTVDMHIKRLRSKLGRAGDDIMTVRGFGYRLKSS
tara:strand:+ start:2262 stop:3002 length:741 start_codon:yes stop_codon:yes gene_type:complete